MKIDIDTRNSDGSGLLWGAGSADAFVRPLTPASTVTWTQDEPDVEASSESQPRKKKETEKKETDKPKDIIAVVGADIITVTRETLRGGTILIEDGKISAIGNNVEVPKGATVVDATGKIVVPGFVAIDMARVGLSSSSDRNAKYSDSLDPFDRNISLSLAVGITNRLFRDSQRWRRTLSTGTRRGFSGDRALSRTRSRPSLPSQCSRGKDLFATTVNLFRCAHAVGCRFCRPNPSRQAVPVL